MIRFIIAILTVSCLPLQVLAATYLVPTDYKTLQAAINISRVGDTILVSPGTYVERIQLKPGITLRSDGDNSAGKLGLKRAERTIIDGGGNQGKRPGVLMADSCTLDGFTITNVGQYDEITWKKHFASQGELLGDEEGSVQAEGTIPAVSIKNVICRVSHCIIHHNGDVGIGILGNQKTKTTAIISFNHCFRNLGGGIGVAEGAEPLIQYNQCKENLRVGIGCRKANPIIIGNSCFGNIRAGIGCREGSQPVIRRNKCYQNRRAGIGIRMQRTSPLVEGNVCEENETAGIGCRDGASPILQNNICRKNKMAGIGCRDSAKPLIINNECLENAAAGIGVQKLANATIQGNKCVDNKTVAIGVIEGATATITNNELQRTGGQPPLLAVKDGSTASIRDNHLKGGGVAAILVQGKVHITGNQFTGTGVKQGNAIWIWEKSTATVSDNVIDSYRMAVTASKASVIITDNQIKHFQGIAIIVKNSIKPAHIYGNTADSPDANAKIIEVTGPTGIVKDNVLK